MLCGAAVVQGGVTLSGITPFLLAGAIAPGLSNVFITLGIREAGASRASVAFGTAPLFAVTIAVVAFDERPDAAVLLGALLIVCGGIALALEQERPHHVRRLGIAFALLGAALFALRDNIVRDLSLDSDVPSMTAGAVMEVRQALEANDLADLNAKATALEQAAQPLAQAVYAEAQQAASTPPPSGDGGGTTDEVVEDADYEVIDDEEVKAS